MTNLITSRDLRGHWDYDTLTKDGDPTWVPAPARTDVVTVRLSLPGLAVEAFLKSVARFGRIAARHGQQFNCVEAGTERVPHPFLKKRTVTRWLYDVTLPPLAGEKGRILGHFEKSEDGQGLYVHLFAETRRAEVEAFKPRAGECDHCGHKRDRLQSYVCETTKGVVIVGSTCLHDFLGIDPALALSSKEFWSSINGDKDPNDPDNWGHGGKARYEVTDVARAAYRVARKHGGYSKEVRDLLYTEFVTLLTGRKVSDHERAIHAAYKGFDPILDLQALADYVEGGTGDFAHNLKTALIQEWISEDRLRLVLAGVGMFVGKTLQRTEEAAQRAAAPASVVFPYEVGQRINFIGEVTRTFLSEGTYGVTCIVTIKTKDGWSAVNFHTGQNRPEAGETYAIRATIKRHGTNKRTGEAETTLSRAVYELLGAA